MGTHFFWFYDVVLVAVFAGVVFRCTRQGFAMGIVGLVGSLLAFIIALGLCTPISNNIYDNFVQPGIMEKISYEAPTANKGSVEAAFATLRDADMSKALISGKTIEEFQMEIKSDEAEKISLDLYEVDLSQTGIAEGDLSFFGIDAVFALAPSNPGKVDINASEYANNELEDIVLSRVVSHRISERAKSNYEELDAILTDTIPGFSRVSKGSTDVVSMLLLGVLTNGADSLESAVNDNLVKPVLIVPFKTLVFVILFSLITFLITLIAKSMQVVNNIPFVGKVNHLLGAALGIVQAAVIIFLICIGVRIIISLTADNIILLNTMTIDETYIFKHIYGLEFLRF